MKFIVGLCRPVFSAIEAFCIAAGQLWNAEAIFFDLGIADALAFGQTRVTLSLVNESMSPLKRIGTDFVSIQPNRSRG